YKGIEAEHLSDEAKNFIHEHICILSGLYGTIKPLECIKPYRLEMGTKLMNPVGKDLYAFWKEHLTQAVFKVLASTGGEQVLINLASDEYSKALNLKEISQTYPVIQVSFKEKKGDTYKVVGMYAKRARGRMVRYIGEGAIDTVEGIKRFDEEGYALNDDLSSETHLVFTR
ncbi:MAG: peroxide stress protein YaaA, partial [Niameybacter sp.]